MTDNVNHPAHYNAYEGLEVIQLTEQLNFCKGNAVKYIARAGLKNPDTEIEDLQKAVWYLEREIARLAKKADDTTNLKKRLDKARAEKDNNASDLIENVKAARAKNKKRSEGGYIGGGYINGDGYPYAYQATPEDIERLSRVIRQYGTLMGVNPPAQSQLVETVSKLDTVNAPDASIGEGWTSTLPVSRSVRDEF